MVVAGDPGDSPDQESRMKAIWPKDARSRLMLTLQLAVILPAAILVFLSANHLKDIHRSRTVEAAFQLDFNEALAIYEKQINHKAYAYLNDAREEFPAPGLACDVTLDRILVSNPYFAHVAVYDPEGGFVFRSQPNLLKNNPGFSDESQYAAKMYEAWFKLEYDSLVHDLSQMTEKGTPFKFISEWDQRGERHLYVP